MEIQYLDGFTATYVNRPKKKHTWHKHNNLRRTTGLVEQGTNIPNRNHRPVYKRVFFATNQLTVGEIGLARLKHNGDKIDLTCTETGMYGYWTANKARTQYEWRQLIGPNSWLTPVK